MNIDNKNICPSALGAIQILEKCGYEAYITGGAIRDIVMGKTPKDYDITTSACPEEIKQAFSEYKTIETGIKYGTVTVIIDKVPLEITTFRIDGKYLNSRKPESVTFSRSISDDLSRRDFTINALAYSPQKGFIDLFGGKCDIAEKTIKAIGNADERFNEDALRILRALRFSSELGFKIEENTHSAILKNKNLLEAISKERIRAEFCRILTGRWADEVLCKYFDVIKVFIPLLSENCSFGILKNLSYDLETRLSVFLLKYTYFTSYSKILKELKFDNKTIKNVNLITSKYFEEITPTYPCVKMLLCSLGKDLFKKLLNIFIAEKKVLNLPLDREKLFEDISNDIIDNKICYQIKDLAINGCDLLNTGIPQKYIGKVLSDVFLNVIEENIENKKSVLLKHAESFYKSIKN